MDENYDELEEIVELLRPIKEDMVKEIAEEITYVLAHPSFCNNVELGQIRSIVFKGIREAYEIGRGTVMKGNLTNAK